MLFSRQTQGFLARCAPCHPGALQPHNADAECARCRCFALERHAVTLSTVTSPRRGLYSAELASVLFEGGQSELHLPVKFHVGNSLEVTAYGKKIGKGAIFRCRAAFHSLSGDL